MSSLRKIVLLGSGRCVWDDYSQVKENHDVLAVNDVGMHCPILTHWYSNDAKMLGCWVKARRPEYQGSFKLHTNRNGCPDAIIHEDLGNMGNSGSAALRLVFKLGYDGVIVCGVPLDNSGHYFDPLDKFSNYDNSSELDEWCRAVLPFKGRVFSLSGNTKKIIESL